MKLKATSLKLCHDILGVCDSLGFDKDIFPLNLVQNCLDVLFNLFGDCSRKLLLNLLAVLQPSQLLITAVDHILFDLGLRSCVNRTLKGVQVDLLLGKQVDQSLLHRLSVHDHLSVAVALVDGLC